MLWSRNVTAAANSSNSSSSSTTPTPPTPQSRSSSTTIPPMSHAKPQPGSPGNRSGASPSLSRRPMAPGSISSKASSRSWRGRYCGTSASAPNTNSSCASWPASLTSTASPSSTPDNKTSMMLPDAIGPLFRKHATSESEDAVVSASAPALLAGSANTGYLSSQTSSMRQPLVMLLTMIVNPFTHGCQQLAPRL